MSARSAYQPPSQFGNYDVHELLGKGGMAAVFRGEHRLLQRPVAIKFLRTDLARSSSARQRFLREAQLVAKLSHPNIVTVFDFGELDDGTYFQASELVAGKTLREVLKARPLDLAVALRFARQIAVGLASAHASGVIHRDLKPSNVMVVPDATEPDGHRLKILDFGIAKSLDLGLGSLDPGGPITKVGIRIGTPGYMAPEQCIGVGEIGPTVDIYSLGVVLYVMLCGQPPFETSDLERLLDRHLHETPRRPSEHAAVTPGIDELVMRCLAKSAADRPQSMTEVIQRIDDELGVPSERPSSPALEPAVPRTPASGSAGTAAPVDPGGDRRTVQLASERVPVMRVVYEVAASGTSIELSAPPDTLQAAASTASTASGGEPAMIRPGWRRSLAIAAGVIAIAAVIIVGTRGGGDPAVTAPRPPPAADRPAAAPIAPPAVPPTPAAPAPAASTPAEPSASPGAAVAAPTPAAPTAPTPPTAASPSSASASADSPDGSDVIAPAPAPPERRASHPAVTGENPPPRRAAHAADERKPASEPRRVPDKKPAKADPRPEPAVDERKYERAVY